MQIDLKLESGCPTGQSGNRFRNCPILRRSIYFRTSYDSLKWGANHVRTALEGDYLRRRCVALESLLFPPDTEIEKTKPLELGSIVPPRHCPSGRSEFQTSDAQVNTLAYFPEVFSILGEIYLQGPVGFPLNTYHRNHRHTRAVPGPDQASSTSAGPRSIFGRQWQRQSLRLRFDGRPVPKTVLTHPLDPLPLADPQPRNDVIGFPEIWEIMVIVLKGGRSG